MAKSVGLGGWGSRLDHAQTLRAPDDLSCVESQLAQNASNFSGLEAGAVLAFGHNNWRDVVSMKSLQRELLILISAGWVNRSSSTSSSICPAEAGPAPRPYADVLRNAR